MYIEINQENDNFFTMKYEPHKTIKELKKKIKKGYEIPEYCQKLYFNEIELLDGKKLSDYNIKAAETSLLLFNLNKLKIHIYIKFRKFEYFLKASDSVLHLKETIFHNLNFPIDKMKIFNSNKIISDNQIMEDFLPSLYFEIKILESDNIKINIIIENNIETIFVDRFSYTDDIYNKLNKDYDFRLKFNDKYIFGGKFIFEYNLKYDVLN